MGKLVIEEYLSANPFNEPILEIESSNERFDLNQTFLATETNGVDEVRFISDQKIYQQTRYYCWHALMGLVTIDFKENKTFTDAIAEVDHDFIARMGIMPTHIVRKTIISSSKHMFGWGKEDSVWYLIYYIHPDQREKIDQTVWFNANPMTIETVEEFTESHREFPQS